MLACNPLVCFLFPAVYKFTPKSVSGESRREGGREGRREGGPAGGREGRDAEIVDSIVDEALLLLQSVLA